jgi:hypothetical protein
MQRQMWHRTLRILKDGSVEEGEDPGQEGRRQVLGPGCVAESVLWKATGLKTLRILQPEHPILCAWPRSLSKPDPQ